MFNLSEWLKDNLIKACKEKSFTVAQSNLMAYNYLNEGKLVESDFNLVKAKTEEIQAGIDAVSQLAE